MEIAVKEPCLGCRKEFPIEEVTAWTPKSRKEWDIWGEP